MRDLVQSLRYSEIRPGRWNPRYYTFFLSALSQSHSIFLTRACMSLSGFTASIFCAISRFPGHVVYQARFVGLIQSRPRPKLVGHP
jgi:hypothetical protein